MDHLPLMKTAKDNTDFRRVLWTGEHAQVVVMNLPSWMDLGLETHEDNDQVLIFVSGRGVAFVGGKTEPVGPGDMVCVPAGTAHNFSNVGKEPLVIVTIYGPADHPPGTVNKTKADSDRAELAESETP